MTTEATPDPTPSEPSPSPEPTIADILALSDEERAALPPERQTVHIDAVRELMETERTTAAEAERTRLAELQARRDEQVRAEQDRVTRQQDDIRFASDIDARLASDDESVRRGAQLERQSNEERYAAGVTAKVAAGQEAVNTRVLGDHYTALRQQMVQQDRYPAFARGMQELVSAPGNENPLVAAIEYGKSIAGNQEYERGKADGARDERIALGRSGPSDPGTSTPPGTTPFKDPRFMSQQEVFDTGAEGMAKLWETFYAAPRRA